MQTLTYKKLQPFRTPLSKQKQTNQQRFWKKYQNNHIQKFNSSITAISSNHNINNIFAYSYAFTVRLFDPKQNKVIKQIPNFTQNISSICIRPDAAVMAIGFESGTIQVMDTKQKYHLRTFKNHKKRINALDYLSNDLYSGGDDFMLRHYDVAIGQVVHSYQNAHSDYIKAIKILQDNHILSASYDGMVKLFDFRVHQKAQIQYLHSQPIQSIDLFPSKMSVAVCGGNKMSIWDVRMGKSMFEANTNRKLITSVRSLNKGRLITSSLDQHIKIYSTQTFQLTHQQKLPAPVTLLQTTSDNQHFLFATDGCSLYSKSRNAKQQKNQQTGDQQDSQQQQENAVFKWLSSNQQKKFAYNDQHFYRGVYEKSESFDICFERKAGKKVGIYDNFLKKFQYKQALITSLQKKNMMIFVSLVDEFIQRGCLQRTLSSLTDSEIENILQYLLPLIHNGKYQQSCLLIVSTLLHLNTDEKVWKQTIKIVLQRQLQITQNLQKLNGSLELLINNFQ